ncbi:MAG: HlyD family secretion protein [Paucimonas sp.]|jgi:membrane fusion protein (multidrug efflux system)|uniref:HlyD family secretion protein n=1 Tax=Pantoea sp. Cy-639 TaxID=2608360 RepID=UPI0014216C64|nr:HlyD family secretion protein [Pantoea sp. Cy-639]MDR2308483.1 HlyD family secretion protein [Paucimonas sp.]NIF15582.1 HlyD family secretion protein [Pantoea sp. Cy-639]
MNQAVSPDPQHTLEQIRARRRQRLLRLGLGAGLGLLLAAYGGYWWLDGRFLEQTDDAYVRADWAPISARVSGYVAEVTVADNATVKAGDLLVRLDERDFRDHLRKAEARLAVSEAAVQVQQMRLRTFAAEQDEQVQAIARAEAERGGSRGEAQRAEADWQRYQRLAEWQAASVQRMEQARATRIQAHALQRAADAELARQHARKAVLAQQGRQLEAELQQRQADLEQARAEAALARSALADTEIRAPFDGVVGQRKVRQQQYVTPGLPLLAVVPVAQAYVVANFKETQLAHMRPGQPVTLEVDTFGQHWQGTVDSVSPGSGAVFALLPPDNATGNFTKIVQRFPVRIQLAATADGTPRLLPGMSVIATVDTRQARDER